MLGAVNTLAERGAYMHTQQLTDRPSETYMCTHCSQGVKENTNKSQLLLNLYMFHQGLAVKQIEKQI